MRDKRGPLWIGPGFEGVGYDTAAARTYDRHPMLSGKWDLAFALVRAVDFVLISPAALDASRYEALPSSECRIGDREWRISTAGSDDLDRRVHLLEYTLVQREDKNIQDDRLALRIQSEVIDDHNCI